MPWAGRTSAASRGYGYAHQKLRAAWARKVAHGIVNCARCNELIEPGSKWELGHDDDKPGEYSGPEHSLCNQRAGAAKGAAARPREKRKPERHPGLLG